MPRKSPELKVIVSYRLRTPQERIDDARRFVATLTMPQKLAMIAKIEKELAEERKQQAAASKGGQAT